MTTLSNPARLISLRNLLLLAAWVMALFGSLQTHQWEDLFGHAICGPWGCGPPVAALIGYHGFWLLVLLLPAWLFKQQVASDTTQRIGLGLIFVAAIGIVLLLAFDGWQNWQHERMRPYLVQRLLFRLATFVDFPLVQLALIGVWLRSPPEADQSKETEKEPDA